MVTVNVTDSTISASVSSTGDVSVVAPTAASGIVAIGSAFQPASHAATHGATGSDPVSLSGSQMQIECGVTDIYNEDDSVTVAFQSVEQYINSSKTAAANAANITSGTLSIDRLPVVQDKSSSLGSTGSSLTLSLASASVQRATISANCTFTMPTAVAGASLTLILTQGGTGFTASFTSVKWPGGSAPTVTATSGKVDVLRFVSDGTHWYGSIHQDY